MASIIRRKYRDADGKMKRCDHYIAQYREGGKLKRVKLLNANGEPCTDKDVASAAWVRLRKERAEGAEGFTSKFAAQKARALSEHIADYVADLKSLGRDDKYVYNTERRLKILAEGCKWKTLGDISPDSFQRWRNERKATGNPNGKGNMTEGASATTLNQFLDTARGFTHWCAGAGRLPGIPVGKRVLSPIMVGIANAEGPKVRKRRALSDAEVVRLLAVVPEARKLHYRVGLSLGLRRSELEQLQWGDLRLNAIKPYVQLRAEATKARRADRLDIPATLASDLRQAKPADAKDSAHVFPMPPTIFDWKADLDAAGITYTDEMGRAADFHAGTRKTLCSRMHREGVSPAVAMRRMRHADLELTMVDYTDDTQIGMEAAVLPELVAAPRPAQTTTSAG
ncbi:MAG TPA: tyrosine-type recombinase/integrase [Tepidisphaeraceae bacterium]|jgi:integrase